MSNAAKGRDLPPKPPSPVDTMKKERANPAFDIERMTWALHGGQNEVKNKIKFMTCV